MPAPVHDTFAIPTEVTAIDTARRWASAHARSAAVDDVAISEVELAMTEALSNAIEHSYQGRPGEELLISLDIDDSRLVLGIRDHGRPFDPASYQPPDLENPGEGGYGIFLIEQLMDEVSRRPLQHGGTLVELIRYRKEQS